MALDASSSAFRRACRGPYRFDLQIPSNPWYKAPPKGPMRANHAVANRPEHRPARVIVPDSQNSALPPNGSFVGLSLAVVNPAGIIERFGEPLGDGTNHGAGNKR